MSRITPEILEKAKAALQNNNLSSLTPLQCHVAAFGTLEADGSITFSTDSIAKAVGCAGETSPSFVGFAVHLFNAVHEGQCPFGNTTFSKPEQTDFGTSLHLGTLRFYNKDGSFNEDNWNAFITRPSFVGAGSEFITQAQLLDALDAAKDLPEEAGTGRHDNTNPFNNKSTQMTAGSAAWKEILKLFACDWDFDITEGSYLPRVETTLLKLFFTNTPLALQAAKELGLPKQQPTMSLQEIIACAAITLPLKATEAVVDGCDKITDAVDAAANAAEKAIDGTTPSVQSPLTASTGSATFRLPQQEANAQAATSYWKACSMM